MENREMKQAAPEVFVHPVQPVIDIFLLYTFDVFEKGKNTYVSTI